MIRQASGAVPVEVEIVDVEEQFSLRQYRQAAGLEGRVDRVELMGKTAFDQRLQQGVATVVGDMDLAWPEMPQDRIESGAPVLEAEAGAVVLAFAPRQLEF